MPRHVRKGDTVIVTAGDHRGKTGAILRVIPDEDRVVVQGVNLKTKHMKPSRTTQGGIVTREAPIQLSNVSPVVDGKLTRVRFETRGDGSKVRVAVRGGSELGVVHGPRDGKKAGPSPAAASASPTKKKTKKAASKKAVSKKKTKKKVKKKTKKA